MKTPTKQNTRNHTKHTVTPVAGKPLNAGRVIATGRKLGPVIRARRERRRMEPGELAWLAGVDEKSVAYWEAGLRTISNESLPRVAHALATKPSRLYAAAERLSEW